MYQKSRTSSSFLLILFAILGYAMYLFYTNQQRLIFELHSVRAQQKWQAPIRTVDEKKEEDATTHVAAPLKQSWVDVQRPIKDSIVQITTDIARFNWIEPYKTPEQSQAGGTGFFISEDGHILTNYHVIDEAFSIYIQIPTLGKQQFEVEVIGVSPERDLALLSLKEKELTRVKNMLERIPAVTFGDSDKVVRGHEVLALGFPLQGQTLKSTQGIVSGRERMPELPFAFIQTTAPLNPGNSGGPAINLAGEVIGINAARHAWVGAQNVGYIIPINEVKSALNDLYKVKGVLRKPILGGIFHVSTADIINLLGNPAEGGWFVARVFRGSLLEKIGVCEGDMLSEVDGFSVDNYGEVSVPWSEDKVSVLELMNRFNVGDNIHFVLYRNGVRKDINFNLEHTNLPAVRKIYPEFEPVKYEVFGGMVVMELALNHVAQMLQHAPHLFKYAEPEHQFEPSLIITHVLQNSQASKARTLFPGAIITEVNGKKVQTLADFREATRSGSTNGYLTLRTSNQVVDRMLSALPIDKIVAEESYLAAHYFYKQSPLIAHFSQTYGPQFAANDTVEQNIEAHA